MRVDVEDRSVEVGEAEVLEGAVVTLRRVVIVDVGYREIDLMIVETLWMWSSEISRPIDIELFGMDNQVP